MASKKLMDSKKINKTKWIQDQPADLSALTLVAKAKSAGFTISPGQVYTARSEARKRDYATSRTKVEPMGTKAAGSQAKAKAKQAPAQPKLAAQGLAELRKIIRMHGTIAVRALLDEIERE